MTEFLAAIFGAVVGAVVGGVIAYMIQRQALREARQQRDDDRKRVQQALGNALVFKMIRISSDNFSAHQYFEDFFKDQVQREIREEPWQFVKSLANHPDPVHFSSEEMGMLLSLKNDDVFNSVISMDVIHNSLIDAMKVLSAKRSELTEQLKPDKVEEGGRFVTRFDEQLMRTLRPRMTEVNGLINDLRSRAKYNLEESGKALNLLHKVLREKLGLTYQLETTLTSRNPPPPESTKSWAAVAEAKEKAGPGAAHL